MTSTALARNGATDDDLSAAPLALMPTATVLMPIVPIREAQEGLHALQALVGTYLQEGHEGDGDYGIIPGTKKKTLLLAGAQKLCDIYGLVVVPPDVEVTRRVEDWAEGFFFYEFRIGLRRKDTGALIATGMGSCNSREDKYLSTEWWNGRGDPADGEGWRKVTKRNGGTAWNRKIPADNPANQVNTFLKMAKKRAYVDAVISATRSSGLFTQDMEDLRPAPSTATVDGRTGEIMGEAREVPAGEAEFDGLPHAPEPDARTPLIARLKTARLGLGLTAEDVAADLSTKLEKDWRRATAAELEPFVRAYEQQAAEVQA